MKESSVGVVTCASMHEQVEECLASLESSFRIYPIIPSCTFYVKIDLIRHYLDKSMVENDVTVLAYGICHPQLLRLLAEYGDRVVRIEGSNCYEMFLGNEKYSEYHKRCYWMLNKPFFTKWKNELLTGFGASASNHGMLIGDTLKKLAYVRFEKDELSIDLVEDFARTVGLEYEIYAADTTNIKRLLKDALGSAHSAARVNAPKLSVEYPHESEIRTMIENIGEVIYKLDVHTKQFTFVSPQVKRILGYTETEFLDVMNDYLRASFYHEDDKRRVVAGRYDFLVKCLNEGMQEFYAAEYRAKHRNGNDLWVRESIYPTYSSDGMIESFVGKIADITERKLADDALRESEERFRALTERTSDWVWELDVDGVYTYASPKVKELLGYEPEEVIGKTPFDLMPPEEAKRMAEKFRAIVDSQRPFERLENTNLHKDGRLVVLDTSGVPFFDADGRLCGYRGIDREITERKKLDQLKDDFIGLVSHELRSPLTVVIGAVNTVLSEGSRLSPEETRQLLQDAAWEADSLSHLLGNLLELSRAQADRLFLHAEPVRVKNVVQDIVEQIRRQSSAHRFVIDFPKELPSVHADQLRLERIMYNLLENAVKYSPQGGEIRVFAKLESDRLVIGIADQGVGISVQDQAKLFGPFQRLEESRLDGVKGAGLGLLVCRRLVDAHGGRIWIESEPGRGSTFFFTLPLGHTAT